MRLETIYLKANTSFSKAIKAWCAANSNEVVHTKERYELTIENYDSLLIISENQSISKENWNLKSLFDQNQKSTYRIDINGTLNVSIVNLKLWLHANKSKNLLVVGKDEIIKNEKLDRFLGKLKELSL